MSELLSRSFTRSELACRCGCGLIPKAELITRLQSLRDALGEALKVTSGARCPDYNAAVGGVPSSYHVAGQAVDVSCHSSEFRYRLVRAAMDVGFTGVGLARSFVHLDTRGEAKVFLYGD